MWSFLTTSSILGVLVRSVFTVFDPVTNQRLKQTLGAVLTYKVHVASTQGIFGWKKQTLTFPANCLFNGHHRLVKESKNTKCKNPKDLCLCSAVHLIKLNKTKGITHHSCSHQRRLDTRGCRCNGQWMAGKYHWSIGTLCNEIPLETHRYITNSKNSSLLEVKQPAFKEHCQLLAPLCSEHQTLLMICLVNSTLVFRRVEGKINAVKHWEATSWKLASKCTRPETGETFP